MLVVLSAEVFDGANATAGAKAVERAGFLVTGENGRAQRKEWGPGFAGAVRFHLVGASIMEAEPDAKPEAPRAAVVACPPFPPPPEPWERGNALFL